MSTDQHEPTTNQQPDHPAPPGATAAPTPQTQPAKKRRPGWRTILIAVLVLALAGWWVVGRFNQPNTATPVPAGSAPPATGDTAASTATAVAVAYEEGSLAGDVRATCALDIKPASCRAVLSLDHHKYKTSAPVAVVRTEPLSSPAGAVSPSSFQAVLLTYTIEGEAPQLVADLVTDAAPHKVAARELIGHDLANETLAQIFASRLQ